MSGLLVLTRDEPRDAPLRDAAERLGMRTLALPLLATEPGRDRARFAARLDRDIEATAAIAWTSRRAGEALGELLSPAIRRRLERTPLFAVGAESAAPLRGAGFAVEAPESDAGASGLATHLLERRVRLGLDRVLFLHGDRALPDLPEALRRAGIEVEAYEVYRTRFLTPDARALEAALRDADPVAVACFSPSAVEALERLLSADSLARLRRDSLALARGTTTRAALETKGYRHTASPKPGEPGPDAFDAAALEALQSMTRIGRG